MNRPDAVAQEHQEHKVEISGWDSNEDFFVENSSLGWEAGEENIIRLRHRVRPGSMIFLRVVEPSSKPMHFPVAFRVGRVSARMEAGAYEAILRRLWPRPQESSGSTTQVPAPNSL